MKNIINGIMILILIPIFMTSCTDNDEEFDYEYDGKIHFTIQYDTSSTYDDYEGFRMYLQTEKIFGCINYFIVTEEEYNQRKINVHILKVDIGDICLTALGPATKKIKLYFDSDEYELVFYNSSETNTHFLTVFDDSVSVTVGDTSFTEYHS